MTWRPTKYLLEGELDNTRPGKVRGWMKFAGMTDRVTFDWDGDFCRDIRGARVVLAGKYEGGTMEATEAMKGFAERQRGKVGKITAGLPPQEYTPFPYIEWYGDSNDRVVMYVEAEQIRVVREGGDGAKHPAERTKPSADSDARDDVRPTPPPKAEGSTIQNGPSMKLLTKEIRRRLPPLYGQEGKGGDAVVYVKFFTPDSGWTWYVTEFSGEDTFFGLACGFEKELGYFSLSELESVRGPMGLLVERDLYWEPKTLVEIAPELFVHRESERSKTS